LCPLSTSRTDQLVDTGSEDTFREMLRIKRAVQASFNTENSFIAAQAAAAAKGSEKPTETAKQAAKDAADPMAAMERDMANGGGKGGKPAPMFVASTQNKINANGIEEGEGGEDVNPDAIQVDEDDI
jgi:pre-mRNA-splicing factor SYF1